MANLSQITLPVKDLTTSQISLVNFKLKDYYGGGGGGSSTNFVGTLAEWNALTPEEQADYTTKDILDDFNNLAVDNAPTEGSNNVARSGGIYTALAGKVNTSDIANNLTTTTAGKVLDARQGKALSDAISNTCKLSSFEVDTTSWSEDTTSQSGTTLYKKAISLSNVYVTVPSISVGAASGYTLPTSAEQEAYNLIQYVTVDSTIPALYLYASDVPTDTFYINVEGVD